MKKINPLEVFLWTFRRNEKDVVNLYDSLSDLMKITTGGDMLNFGFWDNTTSTPLEAQNNMCTIFGKIARLTSNQHIIDVGSGMSSPAIQWYSNYHPAELTCVNINFKQLQNFISESYRILKKNGLLALAIPVMIEKHTTPMMKLGLLSMTWSSEHYSIDFVTSLLKQEGFNDIDLQKIGSNVYEPLARYYIENRESIKPRISSQYPSYVEKILFKSLKKMKEVSQKKIIDYILITCQK